MGNLEMAISHSRQPVLAEIELMRGLEEKLGHRFKDARLLQRALSHSSLVQAGESYERLEFLGDRVLSFVVADMLFHEFPQDDEGALAKRHSLFVKQAALEEIARTLDIARHMLFAQAAPTKSMTADVVEAVIAALYLDGGMAVADRFIRTHWQPLIQSASGPPEDAKSALQEWAQARGLALPVYDVVERSGPDHDPCFTVRVALDKYPAQQAQAASKQAAQKLAAKLMLDILRTTT